jgi:hypothetical protein
LDTTNNKALILALRDKGVSSTDADNIARRTQSGEFGTPAEFLSIVQSDQFDPTFLTPASNFVAEAESTLDSVLNRYQPDLTRIQDVVRRSYDALATVSRIEDKTPADITLTEELASTIVDAVNLFEQTQLKALNAAEEATDLVHDTFYEKEGNFTYDTDNLLFAENGANIIRAVTQPAVDLAANLIPNSLIDKEKLQAAYRFATKATAVSVAAAVGFFALPHVGSMFMNAVDNYSAGNGVDFANMTPFDLVPSAYAQDADPPEPNLGDLVEQPPAKAADAPRPRHRIIGTGTSDLGDRDPSLEPGPAGVTGPVVLGTQYSDRVTTTAVTGDSPLEQIILQRNAEGSHYIGIKMRNGATSGKSVWSILRSMGAKKLGPLIRYIRDEQVDLLDDAIALAITQDNPRERTRYRRLKHAFMTSDTQKVTDCDRVSDQSVVLKRYGSERCLVPFPDGIPLDKKVTDIYYLDIDTLVRTYGLDPEKIARVHQQIVEGTHPAAEDATPGKTDDLVARPPVEPEPVAGRGPITGTDCTDCSDEEARRRVGALEGRVGGIEDHILTDLRPRIDALELVKRFEDGPSQGMHITDYDQLARGYIRNHHALRTNSRAMIEYNQAVDHALATIDPALVDRHQYLLFLRTDNGAKELLAFNPFSAQVVGSAVVSDELATFMKDMIENDKVYTSNFFEFRSLRNIESLVPNFGEKIGPGKFTELDDPRELKGADRAAYSVNRVIQYMLKGTSEQPGGIEAVLQSEDSRQELSRITKTEVTADDLDNLAFGLAGDRVVLYNTENGVVYDTGMLDEETSEFIRQNIPETEPMILARYVNPSNKPAVKTHIRGLDNIEQFNHDMFPDVTETTRSYKVTYWTDDKQTQVMFEIPDIDSRGAMVYDTLDQMPGLDFAKPVRVGDRYDCTIKIDPATGEVLQFGDAAGETANVFNPWGPTHLAIENGQGHIYTEQALTEVTYLGIAAAIIYGIVKASTGGKGGSGNGPQGGFRNTDPWDR